MTKCEKYFDSCQLILLRWSNLDTRNETEKWNFDTYHLHKQDPKSVDTIVTNNGWRKIIDLTLFLTQTAHHYHKTAPEPKIGHHISWLFRIRFDLNSRKFSSETSIEGIFSIIGLPYLGATSIEKIPKISASGQNFLDPLPLPRKRALLTKTSVFRT